MNTADIRLSFFKLNVTDMDAALTFWREAFGFEIVQSFDEADFIEHMLALPGQPAGPSLMLVAYKDGRPAQPGNAHGPVGFECDHIERAHARALASGATSATGIFEAGPARLAILHSPQGHEIELVQLPAS